MNDREKIFAEIREALAQRKTRQPRPEIDLSRIVAEDRLSDASLWDAFRRNFESVRGKYCADVDGLNAFFQEQEMRCGYCDPALRESVGRHLDDSLEVVAEYDRTRADAIQFGITRASGVIAETGTIVLKDEHTVNRLAAVAPWIHVAVVKRERIYRTVLDAIEDFGSDPNIIFVTGPSKTADIEGILIEGVHGPGEQVCLVV